MSELVVFVFRDQYRAPEVLNELRRREWEWIRDLDEAVAVTLDNNGKARVNLSVDLSNCKSTTWTRIWGSLLSATLLLPLTHMMVEAADGIALSTGALPDSNREHRAASPDAQWWKERFHLSEDFARDVAALIEPAGSAIFMLLRTAKIPTALGQLQNYGNTIVHTTLTPDQDDEMFAMLGH